MFARCLHHLLKNVLLKCMQLVIEDHEFGTASASAPDDSGGNQTITVDAATGTATMLVTPGDSVSLFVEMLAAWEDYHDWFTVSVAGAGITLTPATLTLPSDTGTFEMPSADTTVTVTFAPRNQWGFNISEESLDYGNHMINLVANQYISLGDDLTNGTDPSDVNFTIFNGVGAPGWYLRAKAQQPSGGNDQMASRMFLEGGNSIHGINGTVHTQNNNNLLTAINWNQLDAGIEVRTIPTAPPIHAAHQADIIWSVTPHVGP